MSAKLAVVAGVTGIVGKRLALELHSRGFKVVGLSRNPSAIKQPFETRAIDLTSDQSCQSVLADLNKTTHIYYASRYKHSTTEPEPIELNVLMLQNLVNSIEPIAQNLQHIHLVHGTKGYGSTFGPYKTPVKENETRSLYETFYYGQEDFITKLQERKKWNWTITRPQAVCESDISFVRNLPRLIAVYASVSKELGLNLHFPGENLAYTSLYQVTDARQLAKAIVWMSEEKKCANQVFNITNGDFFRWANIWDTFADFFEIKAGEPRPIKLSIAMSDKEKVWNQITNKYNLIKTPYQDAAIWSYGDFIFNSEYDIMSDLTKIRLYGFHQVVDSEKMFIEIFKSLRDQRLIP